MGSHPSFTLLQGFYKAELVVICIDEPFLVNLGGFDRAPEECRRLYSVC